MMFLVTRAAGFIGGYQSTTSLGPVTRCRLARQILLRSPVGARQEEKCAE